MRANPKKADAVTLTAVATRSRKASNQDAAMAMEVSTHRASAVVVADGLGSHYGSDLGAQMAVEAATRSIAEEMLSPKDPLNTVFSVAQSCVASLLDDDTVPKPDGVDPSRAFGTTLVCAVEYNDDIHIGYVGNGAALHIRGGLDEFPAGRLLPWCFVNLLNPHARPVEGQSLLYKWLGPHADGGRCTPSIVRLAKDDAFFGDIVVLCTDGLLSLDETNVGQDEQRRVWIQAGRPLELLFDCLRRFLAGPLESALLRGYLEQYLETLDLGGHMDDDCTVAVLVTATALRYHELRRLEREGTHEDD